MALPKVRSEREYKKFVDDGAGNTAIRAKVTGTLTPPITITGNHTRALLIEQADGDDLVWYDTINELCKFPLRGADVGTDIFSVDAINKRVGIFTQTGLGPTDALFVVGRRETTLAGALAFAAFFGSGTAFFTLRDTSGDVEGLFGCDNTGFIFSAVTDHRFNLRWGNSVGSGNQQYVRGERGGEWQFLSLGAGTWGAYNTTDTATNYERVRGRWSGNVYGIFAENGGTGTLRDVRLGVSTSYFGYDATNTRLTIVGDTFLSEGTDFILGTTTGTKIGTATTQKLGFWNATPIVQPASANQAALTNSTGGAYDGTLAAVVGTGADATINNNFTDLFTLLNEMRSVMVNEGLMKGAA